MLSPLRRPAVALITTTLAASVLGIAPAAADAVPQGIISGTINGPDGPLEGAKVDLYRYDEDYDNWYQTYYTDFTDADGRYSITATAADYRVRFDSYNDYAFEYYEDSSTVEGARTVTLSTADTVVADAVLEPGAHINGEVVGPAGEALDDVVVSAYQVVGTGTSAERRYVGFATTEQGAYDIGGLAGGTYSVEFDDVFGADVPTYATEWYDNQPNEYVAETVTVGAGATRSAVDAKLELDSQIKGRITDGDGNPVPYSYARALVQVGDEWRAVRQGNTDADGYYLIDGLAADTYRVQLHADFFDASVDEYWDDQGDVTTATDIVLGVDDTKTGVDGVLVEGEHDPVIPMVENLTAPVITGTPQVGSPLTSSSGTWSPSPSSIEYYWVAGEELLQSGTSATYTPTAADLGKTITVYVYASAEGYDYGWSSAVASGPVAAAPVAPAAPVVTPPAPVVTPAPVITAPAALAAILEGVDVTGKPKVGKTLKLSGLDKLFRASTSVSYKFQWFAGKKAIKKATKSKLKVTKAMKGKKLSVTVTAKAASAKKSVKIKAGKVR